MVKRAWLAVLVLAACGEDEPDAARGTVDSGPLADASASDAASSARDSAAVDATVDAPVDAAPADAAPADATPTDAAIDAADASVADASVADASVADAAQDAGAPVDAGPPVTYAEVAPIFGRYCISCHAPGGVGPFSLDNYMDAADNAAEAYFMANARMMPPCAVVNAACGPTPAELATLLGWVNSKTPEK